MSTDIRPAGYYWCRDGNDWKIAEWHANVWSVIASHAYFDDEYWDEIDPSPIKRDK